MELEETCQTYIRTHQSCVISYCINKISPTNQDDSLDKIPHFVSPITLHFTNFILLTKYSVSTIHLGTSSRPSMVSASFSRLRISRRFEVSSATLDTFSVIVRAFPGVYGERETSGEEYKPSHCDRITHSSSHLRGTTAIPVHEPILFTE